MQTLILLNTLGVQCYLASYLSSSMYQIPSFIKERERGREGLVKGGGLPSGVMFTVWPCCPRRKVASCRRGQNTQLSPILATRSDEMTLLRTVNTNIPDP